MSEGMQPGERQVRKLYRGSGSEEAVVDAEGMYLIPGLVDIHSMVVRAQICVTVRRKHWMSSHHMKHLSV